MDNKFKLLVSEFGEERIKFNEPLKFHTATKLGGPAECFFIATSTKELEKILNSAYELKIPFFIFGGGTKVLISDEGIKGLVIKNRTSGIKIGGIKGKVGRAGIGVEEATLEVDSGVSVGYLNEFLDKQNLKKIDIFNSPLSTIGGSLFLDSYLQEACQKVKIWENGEIMEVEVIDLKKDQHVIMSAAIKVRSKV